jgi:hypothetical protein
VFWLAFLPRSLNGLMGLQGLETLLQLGACGARLTGCYMARRQSVSASALLFLLASAAAVAAVLERMVWMRPLQVHPAYLRDVGPLMELILPIFFALAFVVALIAALIARRVRPAAYDRRSPEPQRTGNVQSVGTSMPLFGPHPKIAVSPESKQTNQQAAVGQLIDKSAKPTVAAPTSLKSLPSEGRWPCQRRA